MTSLFKGFESVVWLSVPVSVVCVAAVVFLSYEQKNYRALTCFMMPQLTTLYYPLISYFLFVFYFILVGNIFGLVPSVMSLTTLGVLTLGWGVCFWLVGFLYTFFSGPKELVARFLPLGAPMALAPFLALIEVVSTLIRPVALGLRLMANITAGHLLVHLFAGWASISFVVGVVFFFIILLEMMVAFIQAYVFSLLLSLYVSM
uniref:ATP synthase subunit a n=1 Tax=Doliolum nationalis TaxID=76841 RepID=Q5KT43_DOLNA|nr:ATP synthase subunit 6 [Doliolum nationalis]